MTFKLPNNIGKENVHEKAIVACMLQDASIINKTSVSPQMITSRKYRELFSIMKECKSNSFVDIMQRSFESGKIDLDNLLSFPVNKLEYKKYEDEIISSYNKQLLASYHRSCATAIEQGLELPQEPTIQKSTTTIGMDTVLNRLTDKMDRIQSGESMFVKTGIPTLDSKIGGVKKGSLNTIIASSGCGKSVFATQLANEVLKRDSVLYCSMEMPAEEIMERMMAQENSSVPNWAFAEKAYKDGVDVFSMLSSIVDNRKKLEFEESSDLDTILKSIENSVVNGVTVVIIDYIQLIQKEGRPAEYNPELLSVIANGLKQIALRYKCTIIILSQENQQKRAFGSSAITNASDCIIRIAYKENADGESMVNVDTRDIFVKKFRNGRAGVELQVTFNGDRQLFI